MKLTISTSLPLDAICALVGKWAYTIFMRYWKPLVTPSIMFWMWEVTVLMTDSSLDRANHFSTAIFFSSGMYMSTLMCLKLLVSTPRGPVIFTTRDLSSHVTLAGMLTTALLLMVFMAWVLAH